MLRQIIYNREHLKINNSLIFNFRLMRIFPTRLGFYMNKQFRFIFLLLLVTLPGIRHSFAQAVFASEEELKLQAIKLFDDDEFEEAYPLYSQLVSLYPKDPTYNYKLGVCMLYASDDKEKPIPFLEFALKSQEVDKEAIFYLAKAYHLNYRFDDAILKYTAYKKAASGAKAEKLQVDRQIEMCRNGKKLLRNITDLIVIDKKELSKADFYRAYDISDIGGKLLAKPDEEAFKTSLDKKKKEKSIIYLSTNNNQVYFSSYGDDLEHGKDIYIIRKLPTGDWSKPQTLGYPVNTEYDEDFPFLHPNGKVLYFCSKGHSSMGGYDIFKTTLNEETDTWNKPVNLDFPINTPDDDILYLTNTDEKEAYFASARASKTGRIAVFHINVERRPIDVAVIKGFVMKNRDNQALDVKITVKDLGDNTILGIYNAKETGGYLINLPNGGKFMYTVEATGFNTQSEVVALPTQYEFKPLKQEISYELGTDKLIIKNLFDEPVDEQSYMLALNFIKEKSKMEVNANDAANSASVSKTDNNAADNKTQEKTIADNSQNTAKTNSTAAKLSNDDIVKIATDDAKETEQEAKDLQEQADIALNFANQKNELAQNKSKEAIQLMSDANNMTDNVKKQTAIDEANQVRTEADELNEETVAAFNIAKKLALKSAAKNEEAELSLQYAKDLEAAVKSKNSTEALAKLAEQEKKLEALSEKNGAAEPDNIFAGLKMDEDNKKKELDKVLKTTEDIKQEIADNETLISSLKLDVDKTKKEDVRNGILDQIEGLKADNEQSKKDLESNEQKVVKVQKEYNGIKNEIALVSNVVDKAKTETNENAAASVATIDKAKLEQQVNQLKTTIDSDTYVSSASKTNNETAQNKVDNTEKNADLAVNNKADSKTIENNKTDNTSVNKSETNSADNSNTTSKSENTTTNNTIVSIEKSKDSDLINSNGSSETNTTGSVNDNSVKESKTINKEKFTEQIAAADNITNDLERENKKAELYGGWQKALEDELSEEKLDLKTEKDKSKKKELNASIAALENELKEIKDKENTAVANAEKLKQQSVASNSGVTENLEGTASDNEKTSTLNDNSDSGQSIQPVNLSNVNDTYSGKLAEAEKLTNPIDRENAKAEILNNWAGAINSLIVKQKEDIAKNDDPEMKALLAIKVSDEEAIVKEKKRLSNESISKVNVLKGQSLADNNAGNSTNTNSTVNGVNANNTKDNTINETVLARDNVKANADEKENKTSLSATETKSTSTETNKEIANNNSATNSETNNTSSDKTNASAADNAKNSDNNTIIETKNLSVAASEVKTTQELNEVVALAEKNPDELKSEIIKKEALNSYLTNANTELSVKEEQLKAEKNKKKKNELTVEIASQNNDIKEKRKLLDDAEIRINKLEEQLASNSTTKEKNTNASASGQVYTNAFAVESSQKAAAAYKESEALLVQANDLKAEAAEKQNGPEKDAMFIKAGELINKSDDKKLMAVQLASDANRSEFISNKNIVDQYAAASVNNQSDEVAMAGMMKDESVVYFENAKKSRALADQVTGYDKSAALEDAVKNEEKALGKQRKAEELYRKNNQGLVINNVEAGNTNSAAVNSGIVKNEAGNSENKNTTSGNQNNNVVNDQINKNSNVSETNVVAANKVNNAEDKSSETKSANNATNANENGAVETSATNETVKNTSEVGTTNESANKTETKTAEKNAEGLVVTNTENKTSDNNSSAVKDETATEKAANTSSGELKDVAANVNDSNSGASNALKNNAESTLNPEKENTATSNVNSGSNSMKIKTELSASEKFEIKAQPVYSAAKPIPVNEKLPEGLIYKIQIGAFRNPIPQDAFAGMTPLTAETTPQGLTRYTAGIFTRYSTADNVKQEIRDLGYKDAFVVIFLNGKRISASEAAKLTGDESILASSANSVSNVVNASNSSSENLNVTQPVSDQLKNAESQTLASSAVADIAKAQDISNVSGLFYTVQVGVYSKPVSSAKLYNIQPLYSETTSNGYLRYNTGVYNNMSRAIEARKVVYDAGVKDAFVTAYYQGKRVSLSEAANLEAQGAGVLSTAANVNQLPDLSSKASNSNPVESVPVKKQEQVVINSPEIIPEKENVQPVKNEPVSNDELKKTVLENNTESETGIVFKVQIGAFKDEVPLEIANQFIKIAGKGIKNYKDDNGLTVYTLGSFKTYEEASGLKVEIAGTVKDAFIIAMNNGKKISIDEARSLQNK